MENREYQEAESQWYAGRFDPRPQAENMRILTLMDWKHSENAASLKDYLSS